MRAASNDNPEMIRLLLDKGANIEAADRVTPALFIIFNMVFVCLLLAEKVSIDIVLLQ